MDQTDQESEMEIDLSLKIDAQEDEKPENGDQNQKVHEDRLDEKYSQDKEREAEELSLQDENKNKGEVLYLLLSLSLPLSLYIYINTRISFSFCSFFSCPVYIVFLLQGKNICKGFFLFFFLFSYTIVIWKTLKVKENFIVFVLMEQTN